MYCEYHNVVMRPDEQIGAHVQLSWELNMVITGSGVRVIGEYRSPFGRGDIALLPPGVEHQWIFSTDDTDTDGQIHCISVLFTDDFISNIKAALPPIGVAIDSVFSRHEAAVFRGEACRMVGAILLSMIDKTAEQRAVKMPELMLALCSVSGKDTVMARKKLTDTERRAERLRIYCLCNFMHNISLATTASHIGMNKSALCRFMKQHFGISFTGYVNRLRLEEAGNMLVTTDKNIASIAYECGFNNVTYFNKLFRREFGMSPNSYRRASDGRLS